MSKIGKNIRKIRSVKSLSQQSFADLFALKRGTLGAYEEGRSEPKIETIIKIAKYFSIPIDDLLTKELTVNMLLKFKGNFTGDREELLKEQFASIPCIISTIRSRYITDYSSEDFIQSLPFLKLPVNPDSNYRGYVVDSLEMNNHDRGLFPKDVVIGEFIPKANYKKLDNGQVLLVLTDDQLVLRRGFMTNNSLVLRADHKGIDDIEVTLQNIKELWRICYVFYQRIPETGNDFEEKLRILEQEFARIKSKID